MPSYHYDIQNLIVPAKLFPVAYQEAKKHKEMPVPDLIEAMLARCDVIYMAMRDELIIRWADEIVTRLGARLIAYRPMIARKADEICPGYVDLMVTSEDGWVLGCPETVHPDDDEERDVMCHSLAHAVAACRWTRLAWKGKVEEFWSPTPETIMAWLSAYTYDVPFVPDEKADQLTLF